MRVNVHFLRGLLLFTLTAVGVGELTFVSELSSAPAQKLSRYRWYGNARLQHFTLPPDVAVARWLFSVTKSSGFHCGQHNVTIYLRWGAPPVIDPLASVFPNDTRWSPAHSFTLLVTSQASMTFNLSGPAPGDWYVAAHLPRDDGRIEQKGFPSCSYAFQPQLAIRRAVDTPTLEQATPLSLTTAPDTPARCKVFVPEFVSSLSLSVMAVEPTSSLAMQIGSASLGEGPVKVNCDSFPCVAMVTSPPWTTWIPVVVENLHDNKTVIFSIMANNTMGCRPQTEGLNGDDDIARLRGNTSLPGDVSAAWGAGPGGNRGDAEVCVWSVPVLQEELDVLSIRFTPVTGATVAGATISGATVTAATVNVTHTHPTLLRYPLTSHTAGATLNLQLALNTTRVGVANSSRVLACLSPWRPQLNLNTSCSPGYAASVNSSVPKAAVRLPFPESATWYLSLQLTCDSSECSGVPVGVAVEVLVSACVEDCGPYGECRLLRSYSFLYAACVCKAGWAGWGCTDGSSAQSYGRQVTAVLLLTLSNLLFLPAILVAGQRGYFTEGAVYLFTMFFSTFYHACDQPGVAVMCIMDYNTLQFCDFLGSVCSIWVTLLCMARLAPTLKQVLFMLGSLLIAMSMQLDRRGLWNMLGPILCAVIAMTTTWVYRGVRRRQCYPPSWRRWACFLVPGVACVLVGVCVYALAETEDNYLYTHSLWHVLVATSVVFLLPPAHTHTHTWSWSWTPRVCGYTLCHSHKDELYTVT